MKHRLAGAHAHEHLIAVDPQLPGERVRGVAGHADGALVQRVMVMDRALCRPMAYADQRLYLAYRKGLTRLASGIISMRW